MNKRKIAIYVKSGNEVWNQIAKTHANISIIELRHFKHFYFNGLPVSNSLTESIKASQDIERITKDLQGLLPLFARHFTSLVDIDLAITELAVTTVELLAKFKQNGISYTIIPTASSHNLDDVICELASRYANIPQIFHFPLHYSFNGPVEFLPLIQLRNISDRKVFPLAFNTFDDSIQLDNLKGKDMELAVANSNQRSKSIRTFRKAARRFILFSLREFIREIRLSVPIYKNYGAAYLRSYSFLNKFELLLKQRKNLVSLDSMIKSDKHFVSENFGNLVGSKRFALAIYAQYTPEAGVFPDGGDYYNFLRVAAVIRSRGYSGPMFYKEHPAMRDYFADGRFSVNGATRSVRFYERLKELGCIFLEESVDLRESEFIIPVTSTGTIAIERAIKNLPTIVLGFPWYLEANISLTLEAFIESYRVGYLPRVNYAENWQIFVEQKLSGKLFKSLGASSNKEFDLVRFQNEYGLFLDKFEDLPTQFSL